MDVARGRAMRHFASWLLYCRRVAGAIGRRAWRSSTLRELRGRRGLPPQELADDLGVALQLTNILRGAREDAEHGRVYLPAEDLRSFGLLDGAAQADAPARLAALAFAQARPGGANGRADDSSDCAAWCASRRSARTSGSSAASGLLPLLDRRSSACVRGHGGHLSAPARAHRERTPAQVLVRTRLAARAREGMGGRPRHAREGHVTPGPAQ